MRLMKNGLILSVAVGGVLLTGCASVPQEKYDGLLTTYRTLQEENVGLQDRLEESDSTNRMLQQRLGSANSQLSTLENSNRRLQGDLSTLEQGYSDLENRIGEISIGPLPNEINIALERLARQYPGILTYDARLGMVRFSSDLTFDLGSAELRAEARSSIGELAGILNDASISQFEVKLVGHTDSVPIKNAGTRAKHPTNTHLAVHRAISVGDALIGSNVSAARIQVAGYGPHRPLVSESAAGAPENRRVEMYLVPMTQALAATPTNSGSSISTVVEPQEPLK